MWWTRGPRREDIRNRQTRGGKGQCALKEPACGRRVVHGARGKVTKWTPRGGSIERNNRESDGRVRQTAEGVYQGALLETGNGGGGVPGVVPQWNAKYSRTCTASVRDIMQPRPSAYAEEK